MNTPIKKKYGKKKLTNNPINQKKHYPNILIRIVISRCLGLDSCRYNGKMVNAPWLKDLSSKAELISVCPEVEIGLGVPRKPLILVRKEDGIHLQQIGTLIDLTEELTHFSRGYLSSIGKVDAFILKSKSPSCGIGTTKIHEKTTHYLGSGIFASYAEKMFRKALLVDECFIEENTIEDLLELIRRY
jgi:uncharacterized protein YbbK (DUF523 family)